MTTWQYLLYTRVCTDNISRLGDRVVNSLSLGQVTRQDENTRLGNAQLDVYIVYLFITFSPFHKCVCKVQCSRPRGTGECWLNPRNISVCSASNSNLTQAATAEVRLTVRGEGLGPDITAAAVAAGPVFEGFKLLLLQTIWWRSLCSATSAPARDK